MVERKCVVVTGAGAGAGRSIAARFGREGWRVALIARSSERLEDAKHEIEAAGGEALTFPLDIADCNAVFAARDRVLETWGMIDAWINVAMVTVLAPVAQMTAAEYRRVTEVTFLGYVHGTLAALAAMRKRERGAIVQVGSALAYRAIPLQSAYCAAKFAIRGFTDSLRTELIHEKSPITVTMVQMPAMNTPQFDWARNKLPYEYQPVGDIFDPDIAADAVWRAVKEGPRELWVGSSSVEAISGQMAVPRFLDRHLSRAAWEGQVTSVPEQPRQGNLIAAVRGHQGARGRFGAKAKRKAMIVDPDKARIGVALTALAGLGMFIYSQATARR